MLFAVTKLSLCIEVSEIDTLAMEMAYSIFILELQSLAVRDAIVSFKSLLSYTIMWISCTNLSPFIC